MQILLSHTALPHDLCNKIKTYWGSTLWDHSSQEMKEPWNLNWWFISLKKQLENGNSERVLASLKDFHEKDPSFEVPDGIWPANTFPACLAEAFQLPSPDIAFRLLRLVGKTGGSLSLTLRWQEQLILNESLVNVWDWGFCRRIIRNNDLPTFSLLCNYPVYAHFHMFSKLTNYVCEAKTAFLATWLKQLQQMNRVPKSWWRRLVFAVSNLNQSDEKREKIALLKGMIPPNHFLSYAHRSSINIAGTNDVHALESLDWNSLDPIEIDTMMIRAFNEQGLESPMLQIITHRSQRDHFWSLAWMKKRQWLLERCCSFRIGQTWLKNSHCGVVHFPDAFNRWGPHSLRFFLEHFNPPHSTVDPLLEWCIANFAWTLVDVFGKCNYLKDEHVSLLSLLRILRVDQWQSRKH